MRIYLYRASFLLVFTLFLSGCDLFTTARIPEKKFINYYADLIIAQDSLGKDPIVTKRIQDMLNQKYAVTPEQYKATIQYYNDEPRKWEAFFDSVNSRLKLRTPTVSTP